MTTQITLGEIYISADTGATLYVCFRPANPELIDQIEDGYEFPKPEEELNWFENRADFPEWLVPLVEAHKPTALANLFGSAEYLFPVSIISDHESV